MENKTSKIPAPLTKSLSQPLIEPLAEKPLLQRQVSTRNSTLNLYSMHSENVKGIELQISMGSIGSMGSSNYLVRMSSVKNLGNSGFF